MLRLLKPLQEALGAKGIHVTRADPAAIQKQIEALQRKLSEAKRKLSEANREVGFAEQVVSGLIDRHYSGWQLPPAALRLHVGVSESASNFWLKGLLSAQRVVEVFGQPEAPVLDWGCGSGRTRLFLECYPAWREHWHGCDVDREAIAWLAEKKVNVEVCADFPPLPYHDQSFALLFAFSVLTHIRPDRHRRWYEELHRILRPGAMAYVTTQGAEIIKTLVAECAEEFSLHNWAWKEQSGHYKSAAMVNQTFTRQAVHGLFKVEEFRETGFLNQDGYLLRRL